MEENSVRINKFISQCGYCSRREADRYIEEGKVMINGKTASKGARVLPNDIVKVNGKLLAEKPKEIVIAFHKPTGIVCTTSKKEPDNIIDYIHFPERIYPVGRLDKDSSGLILLTNNGQLMDDILRARNYHEKEYIVTVDHAMPKAIYDSLEQGVPILGTMTRPCKVTERNGKQFHITITQGLNRQIRRMCEYFGYRVRKLKRIRIMNIQLSDLPEGKWRYLTDQEMHELKKQISDGGRK